MSDLLKRIRSVESSVTWTYHSRVSTDHRYIAVAVPKVACTTIKRTLHQLEGLPTADRWALEHGSGEQMRLSRFDARKVASWLTSPEWFRFTFVRNPYDRILSAWKSKILTPHDTQYAPLRAQIRHAFDYPHSDADEPIVAFGDFVRFVSSSTDPAVTQDGHWDRQVTVGAHDLIPYDFVGRFERFDADMTEVLDRLRAPAGIRQFATEVTNPTQQVPAAAAYDSDLAALVYDLYRSDFERFGYERNSWLTPKLP